MKSIASDASKVIRQDEVVKVHSGTVANIITSGDIVLEDRWSGYANGVGLSSTLGTSTTDCCF